ncbi:MAG: hypothetical protein O2840_00400 [bacterium]|nr:hypothetical protein [bacterium]
MSKTFVLIDSHALIYRAYHAFPNLTAPDGTLVNAVYGFSRSVLVAIRDLKPTYIAATFDSKGKTKRAEAYTEYKAHRMAMPDDLIPQIALVKDVVSALNIPQFSQDGIEADDLLGTITQQVEQQHPDVRSIIVTGDKDIFQLVSEKTHAWLPGRGRGSLDTEYDEDEVLKKMGVPVSQIIDLKALMGDSSDNIPGVKGVGPKTARQLLERYHSLAGIYKRVDELLAGDAPSADEVLVGSVFKKIAQDREMAFLSQKLATIDRAVPIDFALEPCAVSEYNKEAASTLFEKFNFKSLHGLLPKDTFELSIQKALF